MNNMFSKAAIWVVILLVLFMLFKQFDNHGLSTGATQVAYSDFLDQVRTKQIKDAVLEGTNIVATTQEGKKIKANMTFMDHGLIGDLLNNGVKFDIKAPEEQGFLSQVFISWFPMLLLIGVWVFFMRQMQGGGKGGAFSFGKSKARMLDETNNASLLPMSPVATKPRKKSANWSISCAIRPNSRSWADAFRAAC